MLSFLTDVVVQRKFHPLVKPGVGYRSRAFMFLTNQTVLHAGERVRTGLFSRWFAVFEPLMDL